MKAERDESPRKSRSENIGVEASWTYKRGGQLDVQKGRPVGRMKGVVSWTHKTPAAVQTLKFEGQKLFAIGGRWSLIGLAGYSSEEDGIWLVLFARVPSTGQV